jgi:hypothetical protein
MPMFRFVCLLLAALLPAAVTADDRDILTRLMSEPITLFDWGLAQLDRDIAYAALRTLPGRTGMAEPRTGTLYDWRSREVTLYVSVAAAPAERTRRACIDTFHDIVDALIAGAPAGPDAAGWYLLHAFKPKAHYWGNRFEDIGARLLDVVRLEISYVAATADAVIGDTRRVRCGGRLDASSDQLEIELIS